MAESEPYRSACWPQTRADETKEAEAGTASFAFDARDAALALTQLLSLRGLERPCETLVAWAREA
jgi:hypothetical protein